MKKATRIRCQCCGDGLLTTDAIVYQRKRICADCHQRATHPRTSQHMAVEFTCADCGIRFILATGELAAHRDTRFCLTCWRAQRFTTRITATRGEPVYTQEPIRTSMPLWAIELGLDWPCTADDVEQRGRELAKTHHPDQGGDAAKFIIKRGYIEQARAWFVESQVTQ